uniref:Uncharacterized protein n=1 Tax=Opuntia streptacantha TaxID=393608 RepID=A0A7C9DID4_OPUST
MDLALQASILGGCCMYTCLDVLPKNMLPRRVDCVLCLTRIVFFFFWLTSHINTCPAPLPAKKNQKPTSFDICKRSLTKFLCGKHDFPMRRDGSLSAVLLFWVFLLLCS